MNEIVPPTTSPTSSTSVLNPFTEVGARNWLAETLWKETPPRLRRPLILIGNGPFDAVELARFLRRYEIDSYVNGLSFDSTGEESAPGDPWGLISSAEPPLIVLGLTNVLGLEFLTLLSDACCADKPLAESKGHYLPPTFPHWLNRVSFGPGEEVIQRSRTLKDIQFTSQEGLLACLFSDCSSPTNLPAPWPDHFSAHPFVGKLETFRRKEKKDENFNWPSTAAEPSTGSGTVDKDSWPHIGLLSYAGYAVGLKGKQEAVRWQVLSRVFEMVTLPRLESEVYVLSWGVAKSASRLRKMAESIAAFCRNAKRKDGSDMDLAIDEWESDLAWLKRTYYDGRFDRAFAWPETELD